MSTLEINKIVAALLTVGVVAGFSAFLASLIMQPHKLEEPAYVVAGAAAEEDSGEAMEEAADDLAAMMASAEEAAGQNVARKCTACHTFEQGGANKIGPNLWNLLDRPIASVGGFGYSDVLQGKSGDSWTYENLNAFIHKPKDFAPGTKMSFAGLKKMEDRANLILYMRSMSDSPPPLPEASAASASGEESAAAAEEPASSEEPAAAEAGAPASEVVALLASADEAAGQKVAKKCTACHTFEQGGAQKIGPNLWNVLDRQIAGVEGFKYSDALNGMASDTWTFDSLDAFLAKPKDFAPGTKMSFAGVRKPDDRANLILYIRNQSDSPAPLPE